MELYNVGDIVVITDNVDYDIKEIGTVRLVEKDNEIPDLYWIYIRANNENLNIQYDNRIGTYWRIIENVSRYIKHIGEE